VPKDRDRHPYNVDYYRTHRDAELQRVKRRQRQAVDLLRELRRVPCTDCGRRFPPCAMDFDHREPGTKAFWILQRAGSVSVARLTAELDKCDIVCANCHRERTHVRALERRAARIVAGLPPHTESRLRREQTELIQRLRHVPCVDCHELHPFYAMDFDHRTPIHKTSEVPRLLGRVSTPRLLDEIAKCDIVCANCHRIRTEGGRAAKLVS